MTPDAPYIQHVTAAGERWDSIAWQYYGDATNYSGIIMANPGVPIYPVFPAGVAIAIPLIEQPPAPVTDLPPWETL